MLCFLHACFPFPSLPTQAPGEAHLTLVSTLPIRAIYLPDCVVFLSTVGGIVAFLSVIQLSCCCRCLFPAEAAWSWLSRPLGAVFLPTATTPSVQRAACGSGAMGSEERLCTVLRKFYAAYHKLGRDWEVHIHWSNACSCPTLMSVQTLGPSERVHMDQGRVTVAQCVRGGYTDMQAGGHAKHMHVACMCNKEQTLMLCCHRGHQG